ncbi:MAG: DUF167 domain-containing protein [Fibrobacterota bacterium]
MTLSVRLSPNARQTVITGFENNVLKVRVAAKPVDNAANEALIMLLAKTARVAKSAVRITSGTTSRNKRVEINGINELRLE